MPQVSSQLANSNKIPARLSVVEDRAGSYVRGTNSVPRFPTAGAGGVVRS